MVSESNFVMAHFFIRFNYFPPLSSNSVLQLRACSDIFLPLDVSNYLFLDCLFCFRHVMDTGLFTERLQCKQVVSGLGIPRATCSEGWGTNKHVLHKTCLCRSKVDTSRLGCQNTMNPRGLDIFSCGIPPSSAPLK